MIEDWGNENFDISAEVIDFTSQEKNKICSARKFIFELLKVESKRIRIATPTINKISEYFVSAHELYDLGK